MSTHTLTPAQANFEIILLNAEAESVSSKNLYLWLQESGLPSEVAIRLQGFVDTTAQVVGGVISVGKIVLLKIIDFVRANPHMAIGIAIGAAVGALSSMIPFLGPYLAPVAIAIGATLGAVAGHRSDKIARQEVVNTGFVAVAQDVIEIAKEFFGLIIDILNIVFQGKEAK
jgi:hypothetical protein